ncbi:MAG: hypothetical protein H6824_04885 [Planctomycetaceae bacterium]|nr:hypothetical protein [Planctomycetaceae bacterium]
MRVFAESFVKERQAKWQGREAKVSLVNIGDKEGDVLKALGVPDNESNSDVTKNWLFWVDPRINNNQVCMDAFILKIESGVVVDLKQSLGLRQDIVEFYREKHE